MKKIKEPTEKNVKEWTTLCNKGKLKKCPVCGSKESFKVRKFSYWDEEHVTLENADSPPEDDDEASEACVDASNGEVDCVICNHCHTLIVDYHIADRLDINWEEFLKLKGVKKE